MYAIRSYYAVRQCVTFVAPPFSGHGSFGGLKEAVFSKQLPAGRVVADGADEPLDMPILPGRSQSYNFV